MKTIRKLYYKLEGYLYILPAFLLIFTFGIYPIFYTIYVSLHKWRIKKTAFLGIENYVKIFGEGNGFWLLIVALVLILFAFVLKDKVKSPFKRFNPFSLICMVAGLFLLINALPQLFAQGDQDMLDSFRITVWYSLGTVPFQLAGGLFLAMMLDKKFKGRQFFRVIYLLPYIVPTVAAAAVFERLFSLRAESFANQVVASFGGDPLEWLREERGIFEMIFGWGREAMDNVFGLYWNTWVQGPSLALVTIFIFNYWVFTGYYGLIYANGLAQIPKELFQAAEVDGASKRHIFFKIILPLLSPTTYFLSLLGIIGTFKSFSHIWVLRSDFARGAADPLSIYIFSIFYKRSKFGYASALSIILMIIVLLLTLYQHRIQKDKVNYGD